MYTELCMNIMPLEATAPAYFKFRTMSNTNMAVIRTSEVEATINVRSGNARWKMLQVIFIKVMAGAWNVHLVVVTEDKYGLEIDHN
jgi:hypothetical protein